MNRVLWLCVAASVMWATCPSRVDAHAQSGDPTAIIGAAGAIAAVEVLDTDYTARRATAASTFVRLAP